MGEVALIPKGRLNVNEATVHHLEQILASPELGLSLFGASALVVPNDAPVIIKRAALAGKALLGDRIQLCDGTADQVEIQAALDALVGLGGDVVLAPGNYALTAGFTIPRSNAAFIKLSGYGAILTTDFDGTVIEVASNGGSQTERVFIEGLIVINAGAAGAGRGLKINHCYHVTVRDVNFHNFYTGSAIEIDLTGAGSAAESCKFENIYARDCGYGIRFIVGGGTSFLATMVDKFNHEIVSDACIGRLTIDCPSSGASLNQSTFRNVCIWTYKNDAKLFYINCAAHGVVIISPAVHQLTNPVTGLLPIDLFGIHLGANYSGDLVLIGRRMFGANITRLLNNSAFGCLWLRGENGIEFYDHLVVGAQGAAVADATDAASVILRLNELLARVRAHGLIAT